MTVNVKDEDGHGLFKDPVTIMVYVTEVVIRALLIENVLVAVLKVINPGKLLPSLYKAV